MLMDYLGGSNAWICFLESITQLFNFLLADF